MVQNSHTDRQVKHKPKVDTGFIRRVETPLSVGLPLTIHQQVRDKNRLRVLSIVYLGTRYENVLNITKRIEHAVVLRMKDTGGYCLPAFIMKCITVFFANIDFYEGHLIWAVYSTWLSHRCEPGVGRECRANQPTPCHP